MCKWKAEKDGKGRKEINIIRRGRKGGLIR
jgi:hypothetical protein